MVYDGKHDFSFKLCNGEIKISTTVCSKQDKYIKKAAKEFLKKIEKDLAKKIKSIKLLEKELK